MTALNSVGEDSLANHSRANIDLEGTNKILFSDSFFKIVEKVNTTPFQAKMCGLIASCRICGKKVKGSLGVSSNFIRHLKNEHPQNFTIFKSLKEESKQTSGRRCSFNYDILDFICNSTSPLSLVKNKKFQKICYSQDVPSRRSLTRLLSESHSQHIDSIIWELDKIEYVCVTADVWSGGKRSFLGYTCHWLDSHNLERKSVALACRRFKGTHSFDRITEMICDINQLYKLPTEKIVYTITDNGSNFIKVFKEFGVELKPAFVHENDDESDTNSSSDEYSDSSECSDSDDSIDLDDLQFETISPQLSKHFSCASHTLNLLATTDFKKIINSSEQHIKDMHTSSFDRCTKLWNKCYRAKSCEIIENILNGRLLKPCVTRWNSIYDSVKRILQHKTKISEVCYKLKIRSISSDEFEYLEEYVRIMEPIAEAIDFLQGEKGMYFGYFLPTIVSLRVKMRRLENTQLKYLNDVNRELQGALLSRFNKYFELQPESWDAVVAAICHPDIKLRFLKPLLETAVTQTEENVKKIFNSYVLNYGRIADAQTRILPETNKAAFFDFGDENHEIDLPRVSTDAVVYLKETILYLVEQDLTTSCFVNHQAVKNVFLKYNTPLPSSAPVERLFSFAGIVNRSRRQKLSDKHFEMLVLRKANSE